MQKQRIVYLLRQHRKGLLNKEEMEELLDFVRQDPEKSFFVEAMMEDMESEVIPNAYNKIRRNEIVGKIIGVDDFIVEEKQVRPTALISFMHRWRWVAAGLVFLLGMGLIFSIGNKKNITVAVVDKKAGGQPGHNGALLHLSNGDLVVLDSLPDGTVAVQGNVQARKVNGQLKYIGQTSELIYNTVSTNRGRQWRLTLPDGTGVWLNAASSIRYPLSFTGAERTVEMTGEVYFEVVHNPAQPFEVKVGDHVIRDIGTAFDINAYTDESSIQTTVLEGSVMLNKTILKAGQQADLENDLTRVRMVDADRTVSWKDGVFSFDNADIYSVMRQISRWYDIEVVYEGKPDVAPFKGEIGRSLTLAQILKVLESLHVHCRIEGENRIVIHS